MAAAAMIVMTGVMRVFLENVTPMLTTMKPPYITPPAINSAAIMNDRRFDDYQLVKTYRAPDVDGYYTFVYLRRDLVSTSTHTDD